MCRRVSACLWQLCTADVTHEVQVIAKRALQLWLARQLCEAGAGSNRWFALAPGGVFVRKPGWRLHFTCSACPCGDACLLGGAPGLLAVPGDLY